MNLSEDKFENIIRIARDYDVVMLEIERVRQEKIKDTKDKYWNLVKAALNKE